MKPYKDMTDAERRIVDIQNDNKMYLYKLLAEEEMAYYDSLPQEERNLFKE